jgi:aromatic ring-opening dioxygenase LigB subunit
VRVRPSRSRVRARVVELVRENRLGDAFELEPIVGAASADSSGSSSSCTGALGDGFEAELLSYECPTYFGMLCAAFEPHAV